MKKKITKLLLGVSVLLVTTMSWAKPVDATYNLNRLLSQMVSYSADFIQFSSSSDSDSVEESRGSARLNRPGMIYWVKSSPHPQEIVSDGQSMWIYDPDLEQVIHRKVEKDMQAAPALILSGSVDGLTKRFDIKGPVSGDGLFTLIPRDDQSLMAVINMFFEGGILQQIQFEDTLGHKTRVAFNNIELNPMLPLDLFLFTVPEGVDLIENL